MTTIAEIETPEDGPIKLWASTCGSHFYLSQNKGPIILLTPEALFTLADELRDYLDARAGGGEDPPPEEGYLQQKIAEHVHLTHEEHG